MLQSVSMRQTHSLMRKVSMTSTLTLRTFQVWCYLLVQLTHDVGFGRAHFLTSCVLLQRSSSTMSTSCIASEEWSAPALFKLSTSLSAAVLLICLTFWLAFDSRCYVFECCLNSFVCACVSRHITHWSEPATSFQS